MSKYSDSDSIHYGGVISFAQTTEVLKDYYALLFPTYYEGEGFAGTLIDALAAGVPVIASDWRYNSEIVMPGTTGLLFKTRDVEELTDKLIYIYENQRTWNNLKTKCIAEAKNYVPEMAVSALVEVLKN